MTAIENVPAAPTGFAFRAKWLPLIAPFIAKLDIRYYLNGFSVQPWGEGVVIMATDGHALAMVYDKGGRADRPYIIGLDTQTLAAVRGGGTRRHRFKPQMFELWCVGEKLDGDYRTRLVVNAGPDYHPGNTDCWVQAGNSEIEGKFPDVARVVPKREDLRPGAAGLYQRDLLAKLPSKVPGGRRYGGAYRFHNVPTVPGATADVRQNSVLVCECVQQPEFMALLMPMRDDMPGWNGTLPAWWTDNLKNGGKDDATTTAGTAAAAQTAG